MSNASNSNSLSWFHASTNLKNLLLSAVDHWDDSAQSQHYIEQALHQETDNLDVLIAGYRYFFYKHEYQKALIIVFRIMTVVQQLKALSSDWEDIAARYALNSDDPLLRLYMSAYSASGFLLARQGNLPVALTIAQRVHQLEQRDEFGGESLHRILTSSDSIDAEHGLDIDFDNLDLDSNNHEIN